MGLKDKIIEKLKTVIDSETTMNVIDMGLIKDLAVTSEGNVGLNFRPSSSICPLVFPLAFKIREAIKDVEGVKELEMVVTDHQMAKELNNLLKED
ncbi:MAG: iron-sulfur cluster assembly protein [Thermodesulfobacteriota bacterium]|nr:iron-sulfur cluster assembly protein [Thermodesulfobacteriota bacterium]